MSTIDHEPVVLSNGHAFLEGVRWHAVIGDRWREPSEGAVEDDASTLRRALDVSEVDRVLVHLRDLLLSGFDDSVGEPLILEVGERHLRLSRQRPVPVVILKRLEYQPVCLSRRIGEAVNEEVVALAGKDGKGVDLIRG